MCYSDINLWCNDDELVCVSLCSALCCHLISVSAYNMCHTPEDWLLFYLSPIDLARCKPTDMPFYAVFILYSHYN